MSTPVFEGSQTIRKPNRWLVGLACVPFALALVAILHSLVAASGVFLALPHLTIIGAVALATVLKRRPFATYDTAPVRADLEGLRVGDDFTARAGITRALYVPRSIGDVPLVRVERRRRSAVEIVVRDESEAQRILAALGRDVSRARVSFGAWSPLFGSWVRYLIVPVMIAAALLSGMVMSRAPSPPYPLFAAMALMALAFGVPSRVEVGADGVLVRWFGTRRFIPAAKIAYSERYESGFGRNRHVGVRIHLDGGDAYSVVVGGARWAEDDAEALAERIDEVVTAHRKSVVASAEALTRRGRPVREWIRALRSIGVGAEANFRRAELDRELLWQVYESPTTTPDERAAAAVALAAQATPETSQRIRVTAEALAEPTLRAAITAAAGDDDEALSNALRTLDEQRQARG